MEVDSQINLICFVIQMVSSIIIIVELVLVVVILLDKISLIKLGIIMYGSMIVVIM